MKKNIEVYSFFPGCSLATSAKENMNSLYELLEKTEIQFIEIEDWNCCGSSSAHCLDKDLALSLASRNLFLAPSNIPLVIACPSCNIRLREAWVTLKNDREKREKYEDMWGREFNDKLEIGACGFGTGKFLQPL